MILSAAVETSSESVSTVKRSLGTFRPACSVTAVKVAEEVPTTSADCSKKLVWTRQRVLSSFKILWKAAID